MNQLPNIRIPEDGMLASLKVEVADFMNHFKDDPRFLSGWGHAYFCYEDGAPLVFDMANPHRHRCSICNKEYTGFQLDSCHITMLRNLAVVTCIKSAILYCSTHEKQYLDVIVKIIGFYSDHYKSFAIHAKEKITQEITLDVGGAGKIMPQGLNEAIIIIRMLTALQLVREDLTPEFLNDVKQNLFFPACELLLPQKMHIHNIPCWINSALGVTGLFFKEEALISEAFLNPFNINEQVEKGVTDAGFWYEGSIHYNFFALEGILSLLVFCKQARYDVDQKTIDKIKHMLFSAYHYAFDNASFPNPSDGWPGIGLKTYSYVYDMGYAVFGNEILPLIQAIEASPLPRQRLPLSEPYYYDNRIPLEQVLYRSNLSLDSSALAPVPKRSSCSFESYNSAILRNETFNVFYKYGHQTSSHAHPDKMSVEVMVNGKPLTRDLSNSGYASKLCNQWHRRNIAHSTCLVDALECDVDTAGKLCSYTEDSVKAQAIACAGTLFTRELKLQGNRLLDTFWVECEKNRTIDWVYHFDQPIQTDLLKLQETDQLKEYPYLFQCQKIVATGTLPLTTDVAQMNILLADGMECFLAKTYGNPANIMRDTVVIRTLGNQAIFAAEIEAKE